MEKVLISKKHYVEIIYETRDFVVPRSIKEIKNRNIESIDFDERIICFRFFDKEIYVSYNGIEKTDMLEVSPWIYNGIRIKNFCIHSGCIFNMDDGDITIWEYMESMKEEKEVKEESAVTVLDGIEKEVTDLLRESQSKSYRGSQSRYNALCEVKDILSAKKEELLGKTTMKSGAKVKKGKH